MPKKYPPEFRADVARVARRGDRPLAEVAVDFDVSLESVRRWKRQAEIDDGMKDGLTAAEQSELVELRRRAPGSSRRTRSCGGRPRTSPRTPPQNDVPAGP